MIRKQLNKYPDERKPIKKIGLVNMVKSDLVAKIYFLSVQSLTFIFLWKEQLPFLNQSPVKMDPLKRWLNVHRIENLNI